MSKVYELSTSMLRIVPLPFVRAMDRALRAPWDHDGVVSKQIVVRLIPFAIMGSLHRATPSQHRPLPNPETLDVLSEYFGAAWPSLITAILAHMEEHEV